MALFPACQSEIKSAKLIRFSCRLRVEVGGGSQVSSHCHAIEKMYSFPEAIYILSLLWINIPMVLIGWLVHLDHMTIAEHDPMALLMSETRVFGMFDFRMTTSSRLFLD